MHTIAVPGLKGSFVLVPGYRWNPPLQIFFLGRSHLESLAWFETSLALSQPAFLVHLVWTENIGKETQTKSDQVQHERKLYEECI